MPGRFMAPVVASRTFGCASELVVEVPPSFHAEPGQFVQVLCGGPGNLLRRPYSLFAADRGTASLLVREVGAGSAWLRSRRAGEELDLLGPLGRGFALEGAGSRLLVAGGMGIVPLRFLASRIRERGEEAALYWGMESREEYGDLPGLLQGEFNLHLATMDGSAGRRGSVLDLFRAAYGGEHAAVYACGPRAMLAGLAATMGGAGDAALQVCMEERMACGVGACRGCAVPARDPEGGYLTVCRDGPVFHAAELDWGRIWAWR